MYKLRCLLTGFNYTILMKTESLFIPFMYYMVNFYNKLSFERSQSPVDPVWNAPYKPWGQHSSSRVFPDGCNHLPKICPKEWWTSIPSHNSRSGWRNRMLMSQSCGPLVDLFSLSPGLVFRLQYCNLPFFCVTTLIATANFSLSPLHTLLNSGA